MLFPFREPALRRHASARLAPSQTAAASSKLMPAGMCATGPLSRMHDELRVRAGARDAEDAVADLELGDRGAGRLDDAGELHARGSAASAAARR